jgi:hypothetical protein
MEFPEHVGNSIKSCFKKTKVISRKIGNKKVKPMDEIKRLKGDLAAVLACIDQMEASLDEFDAELDVIEGKKSKRNRKKEKV